jgi:hypothetical protein
MIFHADVEDILMVLNGVGPGSLLAALEILIGIEDAIADIDRKVMY